MADWYYAKEGRQHGPVSSSQLRQLASSGQLLPDDLVFREGSSNWVAASTVSGLFPPGGVVPARSSAPSRPEPAAGGFAFDEGGGDEDAPVRSPGRSGRRGSYLGDVLMFRRFIAPFVIMVLFWLGVLGALGYGLFQAVMGILAFRVSVPAGLLLIAIALFSVPIGILVVRMYAEMGLLAFRMYETLLDIKELLEKQRKS